MSHAHGWRAFIAGTLAACIGVAPSRAQEPRWTSDDVTLTTPTGVLAGTITRPTSPTCYPLVLLIAGPGPTDRNGNTVGAVS